MPRLTQSVYEHQRQFAIDAIARNPLITRALNDSELRAIVLFFATRETMSSAELRQHRRAVLQYDPSVPQCAGKAMRRLEIAVARSTQADMEASTANHQGRRRRGKVRHISVHSVLREQPDARAIARAVIELAKIIAVEQQRQEDVDRDRPFGNASRHDE